MSHPLEYIKAIYGAILAFLSSIATVMVGDVTFGAISQGQWLTAAIAGLVTGGGIFGVANKTPTV
ncbi:MAG: hypothetical protein ACREOB_04145 [Thermodesulfobacteriota bacterium]